MKKVMVTRIFKFNELLLPDLDSAKSPEEIKKIYGKTYAELTNATIKGPTIQDEKETYQFVPSFGPKG